MLAAPVLSPAPVPPSASVGADSAEAEEAALSAAPVAVPVPSVAARTPTPVPPSASVGADSVEAEEAALSAAPVAVPVPSVAAHTPTPVAPSASVGADSVEAEEAALSAAPVAVPVPSVAARTPTPVPPSASAGADRRKRKKHHCLRFPLHRLICLRGLLLLRQLPPLRCWSTPPRKLSLAFLGYPRK
jgi:hypothetical protein